jgi:hypothetical protein
MKEIWNKEVKIWKMKEIWKKEVKIIKIIIKRMVKRVNVVKKEWILILENKKMVIKLNVVKNIIIKIRFKDVRLMN